MIITIGRQHGSMGHDIARLLARELNLNCYDKEIVEEAAANSPYSKEIFESFDERRVAAYVLPMPDFGGLHEGFQLNMRVASAQFDAVRSLAERGGGIFVGRCADYILRGRPDLIRVFIYGDLQNRIRTIMSRKDLSEDQARKLIKEVDKDRSSYYRYYTDQTWGETANYDLCVNSSRLGAEGAAQVIRAFAESIPHD